MRIRPAVLACWLATCGLAPADEPPAAPPSFGEAIEVNVVNVDVHVTDRDGRPVTDLRREDFEILEDGKRMEVSNFRRVEPEGGPAASLPAASPSPQSATAPQPPPGQLPPEERLHLIVYVDNFNLSPQNRTKVLRQLRSFLRDLSPKNRVMLVTNDLAVNVLLPFTTDPAAVEAALNTIESLPTLGQESANERRQVVHRILELREAVRKLDGPCSNMLLAPAESYAETTRQEVLRSINAMTVLVNSLSGVPGRKAVLHVSDGLPVTPGEEAFQLLVELCGGGTQSGLQDVFDGDLLDQNVQISGRTLMIKAQGYSTAEDFDKLAAHANANRVTLYTLQASGLTNVAAAEGGSPFEERMYQLQTMQSIYTANLQNSLTLLATETGGRAILNANDLASDLRRMQEDLGSYYSLGYVPAHSGDGREHRIEVKVRRPGLQVRYRRGYRDKPAIERAVDRTLAAVYHGFEENPLGVTLALGEQRPAAAGNHVSVPIKLRIPLFKLGIFPQPDQTYRGRLRLLVSTRDEKGRVSPIRQVEVPLQIPPEEILYAMGKFYEYELTLNLPPGEQHLAIAVRDESTTTTSVLSRTLTVNAPSGTR